MAERRDPNLRSEPVPISTLEAAIAVAGTTLYWKSTLERILRRSGVSQTGYDRYKELSKFQILRSIMSDLERIGTKGWKVQQRIVQELANLTECEDRADQEAGRSALAKLQRVAVMESVLIDPAELERVKKRQENEEGRAQKSERSIAVGVLNADFLKAHGDQNRQRRGYELERILRELFRLSELTYTGSYKTETDQIDGSFSLDAFTYLLEARWRENLAMDADIGGFSHKVERRLDATRGVFLSMKGFRDEAVALYRRAKENRIILVDGQDLALILSGRFDFAEALQEKVLAASVRGEPYQRLADL